MELKMKEMTDLVRIFLVNVILECFSTGLVELPRVDLNQVGNRNLRC